MAGEVQATVGLPPGALVYQGIVIRLISLIIDSIIIGIIIGILGSIIGGIVVAMYLPIFKLGQVV